MTLYESDVKEAAGEDDDDSRHGLPACDAENTTRHMWRL
jgi:hypothetical protein